MKWDNLLLLPIAGYIQWPWAVSVPAGLLLLLYSRMQSTLILVTAILWALYGVYEYLMKIRVLCTGECNIRVDLLLIIPLLYLLSLGAVVQFLRKRPRGAA